MNSIKITQTPTYRLVIEFVSMTEFDSMELSLVTINDEEEEVLTPLSIATYKTNHTRTIILTDRVLLGSKTVRIDLLIDDEIVETESETYTVIADFDPVYRMQQLMYELLILNPIKNLYRKDVLIADNGKYIVDSITDDNSDARLPMISIDYPIVSKSESFAQKQVINTWDIPIIIVTETDTRKIESYGEAIHIAGQVQRLISLNQPFFDIFGIKNHPTDYDLDYDSIENNQTNYKVLSLNVGMTQFVHHV